MKSLLIHISGAVQGVGFRPFLYNLAVKHKIVGRVKNSTAGVEIEAQGEGLDLFIDEIRSSPPPLAKIEKISFQEVEYKERYEDFQIVQSVASQQKSAVILPDVAICDECLNELFDRSNRRYLYPLISCTNCGARYTIIEALPFDRQNCSLNTIKICDSCIKDYLDPANRRYHAQAISCDECELTTALYEKDRLIATKIEAIELLAKQIASGKVVAIKSIGGFHIVCDATCDEAIERVRAFKQRSTKPLAVMFANMTMLKECAKVTAAEEVALTSKEAPIVLLDKKPQAKLSRLVAPNSSRIGSFLPNSAIYHLLFTYLSAPIIATSANLKSDPIILCKDEIIGKMGGFVEVVLDYNREIVASCDDSILLFAANKHAIKLRTARGYAPSLLLNSQESGKKVVALGANQKATFSLAFGNRIITSPYQGDLESIATIERYKASLQRFLDLYDIEPDLIVCDKHSGYESYKIAYKLQKRFNKSTIIEVQHHYAHMLSVMAEYQLSERCLAFIFDGTGLGDDGNIWGGEVFVGDLHSYTRVCHIGNFRLLGGERAIKEPRRVALALLFEAFGLDEVLALPLESVRSFEKNEILQLHTVWQNGLNSPKTSSVGRLFDAVCSLAGGVQWLEYEAQAAQWLEEMYDETITGSYPYEICGDEIDLKSMVREIAMLSQNAQEVATRFINTIVDIVINISLKYDDMPIILSGGVFQNSALTKKVLEKLQKAKKTTYMASKFSPNDESISVGQAYFAINNR